MQAFLFLRKESWASEKRFLEEGVFDSGEEVVGWVTGALGSESKGKNGWVHKKVLFVRC